MDLRTTIRELDELINRTQSVIDSETAVLLALPPCLFAYFCGSRLINPDFRPSPRPPQKARDTCRMPASAPWRGDAALVEGAGQLAMGH